MDDEASSPCLKTGITHRSRHSKNMDSTSLIHSFIYSDIFLPQSFQVPRSTDNTMHTPGFSIPCPGTHTDCISNAAILYFFGRGRWLFLPVVFWAVVLWSLSTVMERGPILPRGSPSHWSNSPHF